MSKTMAAAGKSVCRLCDRTVRLERVGEVQVAVDPELIAVIPGVTGGGEQITARRVHAENCDNYRREAERKRLQADLRAFNKKQDANAKRRRTRIT